MLQAQQSPAACAGNLAPLLKAACARLAAQPQRYASSNRREREGNERVAHGVAQLDVDRINVEPLLTGLGAGRYRVTVQAVEPQNAAPGETFELLIDGNAAEWRPLWPVTRGLFRMALYPASRGAPRFNEEAWVLVDDLRFTETTAAFAAITAAVAALGDAASPEERMLLTRAALDELAATTR